MQSKKQNISTSGATAVAVLLETDKTDHTKRILHVGNVGDSRAVLVSSKRPAHAQPATDTEESISEAPEHGFIATRLTFDHRAEDAAEQERIKVAGGFVTRNRVLGILAVSRSFGDHGMKDFVIGEDQQLFATFSVCVLASLMYTVFMIFHLPATPYVTETDLSQCGECPMLILACDGVWDVFSDQEAADLLLERYLREGPFEDAARMLVRFFCYTWLFVLILCLSSTMFEIFVYFGMKEPVFSYCYVLSDFC